MKWSQLRHRLKGRIAPCLVGVDVHQTRYRHAHDQEGEFWVTVGSERIFSAGSSSYLSSLGKRAAENRHQGATPRQAFEQAWQVVGASGLMLLEQINKDLFTSLNQTVEQMLAHDNPVIRALGIIDARYGKRRLAAFDPANEHVLVQRLFDLRCKAEGITIPASTLIVN
ncbi:hypothetical protein [Massilia niabensis]|uniref:Uncharacterized protein n=1 Tax=Massilia niabensis TaxID=544910 RepID=A0ABW0L454_9BURK